MKTAPHRSTPGLKQIALLASMACLPVMGQPPPQAPLPTERLPFALPPLLQADGALHPDWRVVGFPKQHTDLPITRFEAGQVDGQAAVQVNTEASYGTLVHTLPADPPVHPGRLRWRWRLDTPLTGGLRAPDLRSKAGDDAALKVCVLFNQPLERMSFIERSLLRIARASSGEDLPGATLCYVWDSGRPAGLSGANPYTRRVRFISLQGQGAPLGQWLSEERNVSKDFVTLFADELPDGRDTARQALPTIRAVLIGADSDNTASRSSGWVADLQWLPR